jgi:hypothetical protein
MKMLFENWRGFVNEEVKISDEDLYQMWLSSLEQQGIITISDPELNEQERESIEDEEAADVDKLERGIAKYAVRKQTTEPIIDPKTGKQAIQQTGKKAGQPRTRKVQTIDLEAGDEEVPIINLTADYLPNDDESSGFCLYNSQINEFARENEDNFVQVLMFVMGTIQVEWPTFIPNFKFCMDFLKKYGQFPTNKGERKDGLEFVLSDGSKTTMEKLGAKGYRLKNVSPYRQNILTTLSNPKDPLYPNIDVDKEEDRLRLARISGGIAQLTSIPATTSKGNPYNTIWSRRKELFNIFMSAMDDGALDDPLALHSVLMSFQGLGIPKAGFAVQLLIGRLGCIDSINQAMIYGGDIPDALKKKIKKSDDLGEVTETMREASVAYGDMLREFQDYLGEGGDESQYLWDLWCKMVAFQINNPGVPYGVRMVDPRTKETRVVGRAKGSLYTPSSVRKYRDFMGMEDGDKRITQRDVSRDHYLSATGQLEEEILKIAEELRRMR